MKITKQDLDENNFYKEDGIETDENIKSDKNLGCNPVRIISK